MSVIAIASVTGGDGKSTTAINLAVTVGKQGRRVLVVDLNTCAELTRALGIQERWNVYRQGAVGIPTSLPGVDLVPGRRAFYDGSADVMVREAPGTLRSVLAGVHGYDQIILDCPPGQNDPTLNAIVAADRLLVPIRLSPTALRQAMNMYGLLHDLQAEGFPIPGWVAGVLTMYHETPAIHLEAQALIQAAFPVLTETRLRRSNYYNRGFLDGKIPTLGPRGSTPVVDFRRLAKEMQLV